MFMSKILLFIQIIYYLDLFSKNMGGKRITKEELKLKVWEKGRIIKNKNPKLYRKDKYGQIMFYQSYGKNTEMGWFIKNNKPVSPDKLTNRKRKRTESSSSTTSSSTELKIKQSTEKRITIKKKKSKLSEKEKIHKTLKYHSNDKHINKGLSCINKSSSDRPKIKCKRKRERTESSSSSENSSDEEDEEDYDDDDDEDEEEEDDYDSQDDDDDNTTHGCEMTSFYQIKKKAKY